MFALHHPRERLFACFAEVRCFWSRRTQVSLQQLTGRWQNERLCCCQLINDLLLELDTNLQASYWKIKLCMWSFHCWSLEQHNDVSLCCPEVHSLRNMLDSWELTINAHERENGQLFKQLFVNENFRLLFTYHCFEVVFRRFVSFWHIQYVIILDITCAVVIFWLCTWDCV